jgi:hypothetical protein
MGGKLKKNAVHDIGLRRGFMPPEGVQPPLDTQLDHLRGPAASARTTQAQSSTNSGGSIMQQMIAN